MAYNNSDVKNKNGFLTRLKIKFGKSLAKSFPLNKMRVFGLRLCGFEIGNKVYVGPDLVVASIISDDSCHLKIEDRVAIGPRVTLVLSSDANWSNLMETIQPVTGKIILEQDCWLGAGVIILPNVTIGKGAIVGAGAVVNKNVEAGTIVGGVPAKYIKHVK